MYNILNMLNVLERKVTRRRVKRNRKKTNNAQTHDNAFTVKKHKIWDQTGYM